MTPELERLRACRAFLLDMDGTVYVDERLTPGAGELLRLLETRGTRRLFLTNNSAARAGDYAARLQRLGIRATEEEVLTSGGATVSYVIHETAHRSAYVVGTPAFEQEVAAAGIRVTDDDPDCVIVGFDTTLTYAKLEIACRWLLADKPYLATHPDRTCITARGLVPDIAAVIGACQAVTGRSPQIIGKPSVTMAQAALRRLGASPAETAMLGDQLDTDMAMARAADLCAVLVTSDETRRQEREGWSGAERPALVAADLATIAAWLSA